MLPPAEVQFSDEWAMLRITMVGEKGRTELDQQSVAVPASIQRQMVIASADPYQRGRTAGVDLSSALALEQYRPKRDDRSILTFPARLDPARLPSHPMDYCVFDVLVLPPEALAQATSRSLTAIAAWVRAGGSVCIVTGGGLSGYHGAFLDALTDEGEERFRIDEQGQAVWLGEMPEGGALLLKPGLGRAVVLLDSESVEALTESSQWSAVVAHLWKVRFNQVHAIASSGVWRDDLHERPQSGYLEEHLRLMGYRAVPMRGGGQIVQMLMPASVRVIPFWVIVLILALFTVAVGPGDYFILGLLRQRKLTWVLFPCLAIAFTLVTVAVADRYMGRTDQRRSMIIHDIGEDGRVLRQTSLELTFLAKEQTVREEVQGAVLLPISTDRLAMDADRQYQQMVRQFQQGTSDRRGGPPMIVGRVPDRYEMHRRVYQWQPELTRRTDIPLPDEPNAQPRHAISWPAPGSSDSLYHVRGVPPGSSVANFKGNNWGPVAHNVSGNAEVQNLVNLDLLKQLCVRQQEGFFSVVSQISPTGGHTFEDITVLDPTDERQWLMVVIVPEGEDVYVYRKLYRSKDSTSNVQRSTSNIQLLN
jgi:hypothetical protein